MKAVLCKEYGPPEALVMEEVPALKAGKGEVVIQVKVQPYAGITATGMIA